MQGCISPEAVKTDIQGIRNDMGRFEKLVEQKADNTVIAGHIDKINNKIEQTTQIAEELSIWKKNVQADTINYGGGGWIVMGTSLMAVIFIGAGFLLIRAFIRRGSMLTLLTSVVKKVGKSSPEAVRAIKKQLKAETSERDRRDLGRFANKMGTFAEQKGDYEV